MRNALIAVVAGLVLGFLAAWFLLKSAAPAPPPPKGNERVAIIQLKLDEKNQIGGILYPSTDDPQSGGRELAVSRSRHDFAHWMVVPASADVALTIAMKAGNPSPFEGAFASRGNQVFSGPVRGDAAYGKPEYSVQVHDNRTGNNFTIDPPIRVDP